MAGTPKCIILDLIPNKFQELIGLFHALSLQEDSQNEIEAAATISSLRPTEPFNASFDPIQEKISEVSGDIAELILKDEKLNYSPQRCSHLGVKLAELSGLLLRISEHEDPPDEEAIKAISVGIGNLLTAIFSDC